MNFRIYNKKTGTYHKPHIGDELYINTFGEVVELVCVPDGDGHSDLMENVLPEYEIHFNNNL